MKNMFSNKNLQTENSQDYFIYFLFFLTIFLTLIPFFKIGITNCDDLEFYLCGLTDTSHRVFFAKLAGRFYFLITKPIYQLAYIVDSFYLTKAIQHGCLLLSFTLFAVVIKKIFKQAAFALLVFLLLFVFLTVTPNRFIPIIALPVYFTLSFSIFLSALLFLIKYYETKKYKHLIFSGILSAVALLFYENYLTFILFVMIFIFSKSISEQGAKFLKNKTIYKEIIPFAVICILYVTVYYLYRLSVQTESGFYYGSSFAKDFSFDNFFKFLWNPNKSAFPTYVYHRQQAIIQHNSLLATGHQHNFWYLLTNSQATAIVNALIQCFLFCVLAFSIKPNISWKKVGVTALILSTFIFAVNILIAISEKYNAFHYGLDGYITTYYSHFCITLFIALIAYSCLKLGYKNRYLKASVITIFTLLCFCASIIIGYTNDHLSRDWQLSHGKHAMMDMLIKNGAFDEISNDAVIYMDNFNQTYSKLERNAYSSTSIFWNYFIQIKTNRKLNVITGFESFKKQIEANSQRDIYFISKYEAQKSSDILLVWSKIDLNSIDFENEETAFATAVANEATVFYYSANKEFTFRFVISQCSQEAMITVNNQMQKSVCGINAIRIENTKKSKAITSFTLQSDDPFLVRDFAVSNIGFVNEEVFYLY